MLQAAPPAVVSIQAAISTADLGVAWVLLHLQGQITINFFFFLGLLLLTDKHRLNIFSNCHTYLLKELPHATGQPKGTLLPRPLLYHLGCF